MIQSRRSKVIVSPLLPSASHQTAALWAGWGGTYPHHSVFLFTLGILSALPPDVKRGKGKSPPRPPGGGENGHEAGASPAFGSRAAFKGPHMGISPMGRGISKSLGLHSSQNSSTVWMLSSMTCSSPSVTRTLHMRKGGIYASLALTHEGSAN